MYQNRDKYLNAVKAELETNIFYHSLALEACMAGVYDYLKQNNQLKDNELPKGDWMLAGLIHDIDYGPKTKPDHLKKTRSVLSQYDLDVSDQVLDIVLAHGPEISGVNPASQAQWAAFCADSLTGLIVAVALVYPTKKLADVKASSVIKRFHKEPRFAAGTRRDEVAMCQKPEGLNIPVDKFIEICLSSMQSISDQIGLWYTLIYLPNWD